jgi:hypothetical protein
MYPYLMRAFLIYKAKPTISQPRSQAQNLHYIIECRADFVRPVILFVLDFVLSVVCVGFVLGLPPRSGVSRWKLRKKNNPHARRREGYLLSARRFCYSFLL